MKYIVSLVHDKKVARRYETATLEEASQILGAVATTTMTGASIKVLTDEETPLAFEDMVVHLKPDEIEIEINLVKWAEKKPPVPPAIHDIMNQMKEDGGKMH